MTKAPEDFRAFEAISNATIEAQMAGEDVRSLASAMLAHASSFYASVNGREGPDGLTAALMQIVQAHAAQAAREHDLRQFGVRGRA
ncbi:hypothetical protein [Mangrovicoccus sp. HB161399]|uniref:hypothetical protein n=1 Tax=Mangrovicoccus sp. HB161399 TaxID=2720392 RepID=UPI001556059D|nr:hypothetical protein [Mangrovicoccus sp. HB161399]